MAKLAMHQWISQRVRFIIENVEYTGVVKMTVGDRIQVRVSSGCDDKECPKHRERWFGLDPDSVELLTD